MMLRFKQMRKYSNISNCIKQLTNDAGSILVESAFMLPLMLLSGLGATDLTIAYMSKNSVLDMAVSYSHIISKKGESVTEKAIQDLINNSAVTSNQPDFFERGRVIVTVVDMPSGAGKPKKLWQRCSDQPQGKEFSTQFSDTDITLPSSVTALTADHTHVFVEVFYDAKPLTSLLMGQNDANGHKILRLENLKTDISLNGEFRKTPVNPDGVSIASGSCS
jgi:hypothetical protein